MGVVVVGWLDPMEEKEWSEDNNAVDALRISEFGHIESAISRAPGSRPYWVMRKVSKIYHK